MTVDRMIGYKIIVYEMTVDKMTADKMIVHEMTVDTNIAYKMTCFSEIFLSHKILIYLTLKGQV